MATVAWDRPRARSCSATSRAVSSADCARVQQRRDPRRRDLVLRAVDGGADGERLAGLAAPEADRGQVAVGADRVEVAMEVAVGAEQVADVVARGRHDDVDRTPRRAAHRASLGRTAESPAAVIGRMLSRAFDVALVTRLRSLGRAPGANWRRGTVSLRLGLVAMFAVLSLGVAACGDSEDDAAGGGDAATAAEEAAGADASKCGLGNGKKATGDPIKLAGLATSARGRLHADHGDRRRPTSTASTTTAASTAARSSTSRRRSRPTRSRSPRW